MHAGRAGMGDNSDVCTSTGGGWGDRGRPSGGDVPQEARFGLRVSEDLTEHGLVDVKQFKLVSLIAASP